MRRSFHPECNLHPDWPNTHGTEPRPLLSMKRYPKRDHKIGQWIFERSLCLTTLIISWHMPKIKLWVKIEWDQHYAKSNHWSEMRINNYVFGTRWLKGITDLLNFSGSQRQFNIICYEIYIKIWGHAGVQK